MSSEDQNARIKEPMGSTGICSEALLLLNEYSNAVTAAAQLYREQFGAIADGDADAWRFDVLIHRAIEDKLEAKYAFLSHIHRHGCSTTHDEQFDSRRTRTNC